MRDPMGPPTPRWVLRLHRSRADRAGLHSKISNFSTNPMTTATNISEVQWIPTANDTLPDTDLTVMIHMPDEDEPVWLGYHDGETWRTVDAARCEVSHWADLPEPPIY
jgi:hypothetical protein